MNTAELRLVYEINTRVWLKELSVKYAARIDLSNIPEAELDEVAGYGFDAVWLMGVWQRSAQGREIARAHSGLQQAFRKILPDLQSIQ